MTSRRASSGMTNGTNPLFGAPTITAGRIEKWPGRKSGCGFVNVQSAADYDKWMADQVKEQVKP